MFLFGGYERCFGLVSSTCWDDHDLTLAGEGVIRSIRSKVPNPPGPNWGAARERSGVNAAGSAHTQSSFGDGRDGLGGGSGNAARGALSHRASLRPRYEGKS